MILDLINKEINVEKIEVIFLDYRFWNYNKLQELKIMKHFKQQLFLENHKHLLNDFLYS